MVLSSSPYRRRDRGTRRLAGCYRGSSDPTYSPKILEKLSEKGRKGLQRSPTDHPRAYFFLPIPAKFTLGALLVPLFGQFRKRNSANFAFAEFSEVRLVH